MDCSKQSGKTSHTTKQQIVGGIAGEVGQEVVGEVVAGSATDVRQLVVLTGKMLLDALRCGDGRRVAVPSEKDKPGTAFLVTLAFQEAVERTGSLQEFVVCHDGYPLK